MKYLITTLCIVLYLSLDAQLDTDPQINYRAEVDGVDWDVNPGFGDGAPEGRWKIRTRFEPYNANSCAPSDYTTAPCIQRNSAAFITGLEFLLRENTNASFNTTVYYNVLAFEKDGDSNCEYDSNDDFLHCDRGSIPFGSHPVSRFFTYGWQNIQGKSYSDIRMRQIWSYYDGQWDETDPLEFGTLEHGDHKTHFNRTSNIFYKQVTYGNTNTFSSTNKVGNAPAQASNDATYSFVITGSQKSVEIFTTGSVPFNNYIHLIKKNGTDDYTHLVSSSGTAPYIIEDLVAGEYNIIVEGAGTATGDFVLQVMASPGVVDAGSITHPALYIEEGCTITTDISTDSPASNSYNNIIYSWESRSDDADPWTIISGAVSETLSGDDLGNMGDDFQVRRAVNGPGRTIKFYSNILSFDALRNNETGGRGLISGRITTGPGGTGSVIGATITATPDQPIHGACPNAIYSAESLQNGNYTISGIYHGLDQSDWTVTPSFLDHEFTPEEFSLQFIDTDTEEEGVNFQDISTILISGTLIQVDENSINEDTCGIPDIPIFLNDEVQLLSESDPEGNYQVTINIRDELNQYIVRPDSTVYDFLPVQTPILTILEDTSGIHFTNQETDTIRVNVQACGNFCFGKVDVRIRDLNQGCFEYIETSNSCGIVELIVPTRPYEISIIGVDDSSLQPGYVAGEILDYFIEIRDTVDLREGPQDVELIYRQAPEIVIENLPVICADTVFTQGEPVELTFLITEVNTGGCPLDTGLLRITDGISDRAEATFPISNGVVNYTVLPGEPNIFASTGYSKNFNVIAEDLIDPDRRSQINFNAIVEGNQPRQTTFTTVSPEVPMLILRDPPGDKSFSFVDENETSEFGFNISMTRGGSAEVKTKIKTSPRILTGVGVITEQVTISDFETELRIAARNTNSTDQIWSVTTNRRYETNAEDEVIGSGADVFVTGAMILRYGITDVIEYNESSCRIEESEDLIMGADSIQTLAIRSKRSIEQITIPQLIELRDISGDPDSAYIYNNQIEVWQQILQINETLKEEAIPDTIPNISWDGIDGPISRSTTKASSKSTSIDIGIDIETSIAARVGFSIAGIGLENTVTIRSSLNIGGGIVSSNSSERTHGFVLDDDDSEDFFETEVFFDPVYSTPVFKNTSSGTSCPYEGGSLIDNPILGVKNPVDIDVAPDDDAEFEFTITNGTELPDSSDFADRTYELGVISTSNPHSAAIFLGGTGGSTVEFKDIPKGATIDRLVKISRTDDDIFSLEGIQFELYPVCEEDNNDVQEVSAYFITTCSDITLNGPEEGWLINEDSNNSLDVHMTDYNKALITLVTVQYANAGVNNWEDGPSITAGDLNNNVTSGTFVNWDLSTINDGVYDLRLKLTCSDGIIHTPRVTGRIDRSPPQVFGIPSPIDDRYEQSLNDQISVAFTEQINCADASVILMNMETEEEFAANLSCSDNEVQIVPEDILEDLDPSAYRVILSNVEDLYGNVTETYRWAFIVGDYVYDPDCSPIDVSNNNVNQDAISQSTYQATIITSDGTVADGSEIDYRAGESATLLPGFTVDPGGALEVNIEICIDN